MKSLGTLTRTVELVRARIGEQPAASAESPPPAPDKRECPATDEQILERARAARNADKFETYWNCKESGDSPSEGDLALASLLAFYCGPDPDRIEQLMRRSSRVRDKWDTRRGKVTLLRYTVDKALKGKTEFFDWAAKTPTPAPKAFDVDQHTVDVQTLLDSPPPPVPYLQEGLLARGASSLLVGPPKGFKSTLAIQLLIANTSSKDLVGDWKAFNGVPKYSKAAYLDLEQDVALFTKRFTSFGVTKAPRLSRVGQFPVLDEAGRDELRRFIKRHGINLLVIDTMVRVRPPPTRGVSVFDSEAQFLHPLTQMAHEMRVHIMIIAHAGKRKDMDDPLLMIAGTQGLAASVDDVFVLFNKGDDEGGVTRRRLFVTGRHIERPGTYVLQREPGKAA
ncbi:MAG: AAA family ATPase, partial [Steroidobacteraceae bacterium]|nr:AAA family ATPase [Steroidobacteraceae bacterium]